MLMRIADWDHGFFLFGRQGGGGRHGGGCGQKLAAIHNDSSGCPVSEPIRPAGINQKIALDLFSVPGYQAQ
jgi:hypothetical protein